MAFRVGQKVVCVDDGGTNAGIIVRRRDGKIAPFDGTLHGLRKGQIYTVSGFDPPSYPEFCQEQEIILSEINRGCPITRGFRSSRFRPVQSTDTGMAILEQIRRDVSNKTALPIKEDEQA
jgi:hypothetical protein